MGARDTSGIADSTNRQQITAIVQEVHPEVTMARPMGSNAIVQLEDVVLEASPRAASPCAAASLQGMASPQGSEHPIASVAPEPTQARQVATRSSTDAVAAAVERMEDMLLSFRAQNWPER